MVRDHLPDGLAVRRVVQAHGRHPADFRISHHLHGRPRRLLVAAMGDASSSELLATSEAHLPSIVPAFDTADRVELSATQIIAWPRAG